MTAARPLIFISYSHKDETWKDRLKVQMAPLLCTCDLDLWDDRRIGGGKDWLAEIQAALKAASLAILLVSPDFLASKFITEVEIPRLLERCFEEGLRFFPILARKCNFELYPWLERMQLRPKDAHPLALKSPPEIDAALTEMVAELADILRPVAPPAPPPAGPRPIPLPEIYTAKLPVSEPVLFGREEELKLLDAAWASRTTNIVCLVAQGGAGKTALVNYWLTLMAANHYRGAARVFGWSFYSQGTREDREAAADECIAKALEWFQDPHPPPTNPFDRGVRLAQLVRRERCLLILDGLEPLQHPPGEMKGRLKDPGLQGLLRELARGNPGLCIITSRLSVTDLRGFAQNPADPDGPPAPVIIEDLEILKSPAGAALLKYLGVKGLQKELEQASEKFQGHALALTLLGKYLAVVHDGDIRQQDKIPALTEEEEKGGHARRVMRAYEKWLQDRPELLEILRLLGLFDRPAPGGAVAAVVQASPLSGLTSHLAAMPDKKWKFALKHLRDLRLLDALDPHSPDTLDCHPLVREYFGERLQTGYPDPWKEGHSRLYEYYKNLAPEFPDTLTEMAPLYAAVVHGCRAGCHQEAWNEVYWPRICRGNKFFSTKKLGADASDLTALAAFFDPPWEFPSAFLNETAQSFLLNEVGMLLWGLGRLQEALEPLQAGFAGRLAIDDWDNAAISARNLTEVTGLLGDLAPAEALARQALALAKRSGDKGQIRNSKCYLAYVRHQTGAASEAGELFRQAEALEKEQDREEPYLYSLRGFQFCDLLLDQGGYAEVLTRAGHTLVIHQRTQWLQDIGLDHLALGRACLGQGLEEGEGNPGQAPAHFAAAVDFLRRAGRQDNLVLGLLGRAAFFRATRDWAAAHRDLEEAQEIAQRCGMRLYEADCHLEYARLHLAQGQEEEARQALTIAKPMIQQMGYHRRDREVLDLEAQLRRTS